MSTEYEVYSSGFEAYLAPLVCQSKEDAIALAHKLREVSGQKFGASCGWYYREVEAGKRPIPPQAEVPTPVLVDEVRKLMAQHGQDLMVIFAWNVKTGLVNVVTAGNRKEHSEQAYELSKLMVEAAGLGEARKSMLEDRRSEHTS